MTDKICRVCLQQAVKVWLGKKVYPKFPGPPYSPKGHKPKIANTRNRALHADGTIHYWIRWA
jgi:hypothetical protein